MKEDVKYYGIYRGVVLDNNDTGIEEPDTSSSGKNKGFGRCKIFFEGIYPDKFKEAMGKMLPWAEPIFPIFGGNAYNDGQKQIDAKLTPTTVKNWTNKYTGWCSVPHIGAYVWGFFQDGNINYPKFFGMTQGGNNYTSEHKNQHVFMSDNVRIVIDEEPLNKKSTSKYDSNNKKCTKTVSGMKKLMKDKMPTTVNIEVTNLKPKNISQAANASKYKEDKDFCAINLKIVGNVNAHIKGNIYEEHEGDRFITQTGNTYIKQTGDIEIEHYGDLKETHYGNRKFAVSKHKKKNGDNTEIIDGEEKLTVKKNKTDKIGGNRKSNIGKSEYRTASSQIHDKGSMIKHN